MLEKIKEIVSENLGVDSAQITEDSSFKDDLGADSLDWLPARTGPGSGFPGPVRAGNQSGG